MISVSAGARRKEEFGYAMGTLGGNDSIPKRLKEEGDTRTKRHLTEMIFGINAEKYFIRKIIVHQVFIDTK